MFRANNSYRQRSGDRDKEHQKPCAAVRARALIFAERNRMTLVAIRSALEFEGFSSEEVDSAFIDAHFRAELERLLNEDVLVSGQSKQSRSPERLWD